MVLLEVQHVGACASKLNNDLGYGLFVNLQTCFDGTKKFV